MKTLDQLKKETAEILELDEKRTQGEWTFNLSDNATPYILSKEQEHWPDLDVDDSFLWFPSEISKSYNSFNNAKFTASAPQMASLIRKLLARIEVLESGLVNLDCVLEDVFEYYKKDINYKGGICDGLIAIQRGRKHIEAALEAALTRVTTKL